MGRQGYVLGHEVEELARLGRQAELIDPISRRFFAAAGIREGMRVLDVGSGAGHTAMVLAGLVGPGGEVVGVDLSPAAVATARARVAAAGLDNVTFLEGDPAAMDLGRPFDAVAGRYVLMFVPEPHRLVAALARRVGPGGVLVFHEPDWDGARCAPSVAAFDRVCALIRAALVAGGAHDAFGARLPLVFAAAGLAPPNMILDAAIGAGPSAPPTVRLVTDLAATLRPVIDRLGHAVEPDFSGTAEAIVAALGHNGTVIGRHEIAAWVRV